MCPVLLIKIICSPSKSHETIPLNLNSKPLEFLQNLNSFSRYTVLYTMVHRLIRIYNKSQENSLHSFLLNILLKMTFPPIEYHLRKLALATTSLCLSKCVLDVQESLNAFVPKYFRIFKAICSLFLRLHHRRRMELEDKA